MKDSLLPITLILASILNIASPLAAKAETNIDFRNPDLPVEKRVEDLISRLTVKEKIEQTMMDSPAIPRLDVPSYHWWNEALHGVARSGVATVFPQAIALAATWNPELHLQIADAISTEARAKNNEVLARSGGATKRYQGLTIWSPNINIFRDPRWGRGHETYGEDPFLTSRMGVAFVRGLQGNDPNYLKTVATVKHFVAHSGPETSRFAFDSIVSERDLRETYLPAFEAGIREGGSASLMSAYNAVNGIPAAANKLLLTDVLRDEWGFEGAVVGDVDNVAEMWSERGQRYVKTPEEASALAIKAGNDLCSGTTYEALQKALEDDLLTEEDIDNALRRLLSLRFRLGQFDPEARVSYRSIPISENASPEHDQLALEAARQSLVLLKNDGTLPWEAQDLKTVAILGPTGGMESALLGNYAGTPRKTVTLVDGIRAQLEARGVKVLAEAGVLLVKGFRVNGNPFPAGALFTDAERSQPGLKGEVFQHTETDADGIIVDGTPVSNRTDAQIDLQWDEAQPVDGIPIMKAAVRWTGVMVPPKSGEYTLGIVAEGSVRLFIDDNLVINAWQKPSRRPLSTLGTTLNLEAGKNYHVRLEYAQLKARGRIQFGWIVPGDNEKLNQALAAAKEADHIVLTLGLTPDLEGESSSVKAEGFEGGDRTSIALPATQKELLDKVAALKKPTVVVLTTGSSLSFDTDKAGAVLVCWYYGQRGADAVVEALIGETNPAGRLPITFYESEKDLPPMSDYSMANRTYRYFTGKPLFAFGHGLSYSNFNYQKTALSSSKARPDDTVTIETTIKNTSQQPGDEVVQVYAKAVKPPVPMPLRQLVGFKRVHLKAGETRVVAILLPVDRLRRWDDKGHQYIVDGGDYQLEVGPASDQAPVSATLEVIAPREGALPASQAERGHPFLTDSTKRIRSKRTPAEPR